MSGASTLDYLLRRERLMVAAGIVGVSALAWGYLVVAAGAMGEMPRSVGDALAMAGAKPWSALDFALMLTMWAVMMVAMMLPSAAPMILLFAAVQRKSGERGGVAVPVGVFAAGYAVAWSLFSLGATLSQWVLDGAALLSPMMASASPLLGGLLLMAAGIYQWTPLKNACLKHCRSPLRFLVEAWRPGARGALEMGVRHGLYCVGCCWVLMGLLFVGGVMNLLWIAAIALFVLLEKVAPFGVQGGRLSGALLVLAGAVVIAGG